MVLHGTNEFTPEIMKKCVEHGMTPVNVNKLVLSNYSTYVAKNTGKVPLTELMQTGTMLMQELIEEWMDVVGSTGKADPQ